MAQEIDCQIRHCERCRIGSRVCPSQKCLNACEKLGKGERFCQIIIASELKTAYFVFNGIFCTEDDDRSRDFCRADFFDYGKAVHYGEHDVDDGEIELFGFCFEEPGFAVFGMNRGKACLLQALEDESCGACIVFNQKNFHKSLPLHF